MVRNRLRNSAGFLKNSTASNTPRLDFENSPAQSSAIGCESDPCVSIALKSSPPVSCSMLIDFGSPGSNVPIPIRRASEKKIRSIGKRRKSPPNS